MIKYEKKSQLVLFMGQCMYQMYHIMTCITIAYITDHCELILICDLTQSACPVSLKVYTIK
jgi:hypothetical protein